ncbi:MAG TPA: hypothetical protein VM122_04630 [Usitatibacter sp.]|nr:hypothetical protein [Usitatibacter sp.]
MKKKETEVKNLSIAVPTIVAIIGIAVVSRVSAPVATEAHSVVLAPTPYSFDHARVQGREGEPEPQPATF